MQPVSVINKSIEVVEGRIPPFTALPQPCAIRVKVPLQGPRPHRKSRTLRLRVTIATCIQQPIQVMEQPIHSVRCPRTRWTIIGRRELLPPPTPFQYHLCHSSTQRLTCPLCDSSHSLRKTPLGFGLVGIPYARQHLLSQLSPAARSDFEHRMQGA